MTSAKAKYRPQSTLCYCSVIGQQRSSAKDFAFIPRLLANCEVFNMASKSDFFDLDELEDIALADFEDSGDDGQEYDDEYPISRGK